MMNTELRDWPISPTETATYAAMAPADSDALAEGTLVVALIDMPAPQKIGARLARVGASEIVLEADGRRVAREDALVLGRAVSVTRAL